MEHLTIPLTILAVAFMLGIAVHGWPTINIHKHYHNNDKQSKK